MDRRSFFRSGLRHAANTITETVSEVGGTIADFAHERADGAGGARASRARPTAGDRPPPELPNLVTRPPGAVAEEQFRELCTKCEDCVEACPAWAIRQDPDGSGYPVLEPNTQACALCEDPLPCIASCETGALMMLPRESVRLGIARVDLARCVVPQGQSCDFCVLYCPVGEAAIRMDVGGPVIAESGCTGCGMCAVMCPEAAIGVYARK